MNAKQAKYPQLRFKGFTNPWEKRSLDEITTKTKSYSLSRDVERDHETGYRYIHYGDIHTGVADIVTEHTNLPNIEPANYDELRVNDLVVADASEDYQGIAEPAVVVGLPTQHLVAGLHTIALRPSSASSLYLYYLLHTESFKHFGYQTGTGLKVFGISWSNLSKFTFMIPSRPEQEKIVKLIESVDNLTSDNQRKLAKLKELKQGYLQKLFPRNGSKFPQLRFAGFSDAWEQRKLGELADIVGGGTPNTNNDEYWNGDIDWYSPVEINNQIYVSGSKNKITKLGLQKSSAKVLPIGTVLFTSRAGIGKTAILAKKGTTNQGFQSILPHENKLDSYFIFSRTDELKRYGETNGAGSTFVEVSGKQMSKMPIMLPKIEEQMRIGTFFQQLDNLITLHQRKLEKLQELKKGYLQKMFCWA